eukprot:scaffold8.g1430.t1
MLRRSAARLGRQCLAAAAEAGGGAQAGGRALSSGHAAPAVQLYLQWQQQGSGGGGGWGSGSGGWGAPGGAGHAARHFSFTPSSRQEDDGLGGAAAAELAGGVPHEAAAAAAGGGLPALLTPDAILAAAGGAEADALAAAGEGVWAPTRGLQALLCAMHEGLGLEWWAAIAAVTVGVRTCTLPLTVMQIRNTYRLSQARPEIEALLEHLKEEQARGSPNATQEYQQRVQAVWAKHGANPLKSLGGIFLQAPIFIGFFSALRAFAAHKVPSFAEGGLLWFTDLSLADPYYLLPVIAGLSTLLTVELGAMDGMQARVLCVCVCARVSRGQPESTQRRTKTIMRGVAVLIPLLTLSMPAGVFCYWVTSNLFSLVQTAALKNKGLKRLLGLPDLSKPAGAKAQELVGKPVATYAHDPRVRAPRRRAAPAAGRR